MMIEEKQFAILFQEFIVIDIQINKIQCIMYQEAFCANSLTTSGQLLWQQWILNSQKD